MRILVVEHEHSAFGSVEQLLHHSGWRVDRVPSGFDALRMMESGQYDVVVVSAELPDMDGIHLCRLWSHDRGATRILMLSTRGTQSECIAALDAGADDYLRRPFDGDELLARVRALGRRSSVALASSLRCGDLELDLGGRVARRNGLTIRLTPKEFALLEYLARNAGRVVSRQSIVDHLWSAAAEPDPNAVDVLVGRLRKRIHRPDLPPILHTIRSAGYVLDEAEEGVRRSGT